MSKNKKDKKKKKKGDDEAEKTPKASSSTPSDEIIKPTVAEGDSEVRQRKGDDVVTAAKSLEAENDEQETKK